MQTKFLPVTLISGFLGSGKTTLLKKILRESPNRDRIAVVENELGEVPVDDLLLSDAAPAKIESVLGRTCCETRADFVKLLRSIADSNEKFDRVIIESTGVAHPGMMANAILSDSQLREKMIIDGIVTVVDAANFERHLDGDGHAREQVAYADSIIINKIDLVSSNELERIMKIVAEINPTAIRATTTNSNADLSFAINLTGFNPDKISQSVRKNIGAICEHLSNKKHDIRTVAVKTCETYAFLSLKNWLEDYIATHRDDIFRSKGVINLAKIDNQVIFQGVHDNVYMDLGSEWPSDAPRETRIIFIGKNLDENEILKGLSTCIY